MARYDLAGKVALVTGGARGIGLGTAEAIRARGGSVAIVDLDEAAVQRAAAGLDDSHALGLVADVTDAEAIEGAVAATVERFGGLDVVVTNAGIASRAATVKSMSLESFERVLDVNLMGTYRTVTAALPEIVRRKGHVVVVSSVYAFANGVGGLPYAMSKAAVEQLGRALRVELAHQGASASVAYFGFVDTEMVRRAMDSDPPVEAMMKSIPRPLRKRVGPDVAGEAIVRGIERRRPRIFRPRRWVLMSVGRGVIGPLSDMQMERDRTMRKTLRHLDARVAEDQPTTA